MSNLSDLVLLFAVNRPMRIGPIRSPPTPLVFGLIATTSNVEREAGTSVCAYAAPIETANVIPTNFGLIAFLRYANAERARLVNAEKT